MHRLGTIAALAAVAALVAAAGAGAGAKPRKCHPPGTRTIVANEQVRVYRTTSGEDRRFGCSYRTGKSFRIAATEPGVDGYGPWALDGRFVAFGHYPACGVCADEGNFVVRWDARARRERLWELDFDDDGKVTRVTDIAVNGSGRVAWIVRDRRAPGDIQVQTESADRAPAVLDSGADIAPRSLALAGSTVYWTKGGAPQSARLTAP
jgi:hypothetical protein